MMKGGMEQWLKKGLLQFGLLNGLGELSPDLANYVLEFIFGDFDITNGIILKFDIIFQ